MSFLPLIRIRRCSFSIMRRACDRRWSKTDLVNNLPGEARLTPAEWGEIEVK
jgi:hypothetical protein